MAIINIPPMSLSSSTNKHIYQSVPVASSTSEDAANTTGNVFMDTWTPKIDAMLLILRENCNYMSKYHNFKYQFYKERLKWFRIPIIVLSAVNAFTAVGLQPYTAQQNISTINSILSLLCGILTSIELFLNVQKKMENDLMSHKDYYTLSMDIFKMVSLDLHKRNTNGRDFLEEKVAEFKKLIQNSNVIDVDFYIDIYEEDADDSKEEPLNDMLDQYDMEKGTMQVQLNTTDKNIHKARESIKTKLKTASSTRFTDKLEKLCTPNNHRINKSRKDMQHNVQKYSKTIRPNLDANESIYTGGTYTGAGGIGRTTSMEDMTNTVSNSGKYKPLSPGRRYTQAGQNYIPGQTQPMYSIPSPPSMYDSRGPAINSAAAAAAASSISAPAVKKPRGAITIVHQDESPVAMTPPPPPANVLPDILATEQMMQLIPFETPKDILANNAEHKDAGHEESSISSAGMGADSI